MSYVNRTLLTATVSSLLFTAPAFADSVNKTASLEPQFVAGFYDEHPLLVASRDNGQSWSFIKNVPMSSYNVPHYLETIGCTGSTCLAGGYFGDYYPLPLLLKTDDAGESWDYVRNVAGLPQMNRSYIDSTNCTGNICLVNGTYGTSKNDLQNPLLLVSSDQGHSFVSINHIQDSPSYKSYAGISETTCEGNACVGLYYHETSDTTPEGYVQSRPIVSKDGGKSWSYIKTIANLPENKDLRFNSLRCKENNCIATGSYTPKESHHRLPIFIISQDSGQHWSYVKHITGLPPIKHGSISSLTHDNETWVAAGSFGNTNDTEVKSPLLLVSKDKGHHWSFVKDISGLPDKSTSVKSVSCQNGFCVAGGFYLLDVNEPNSFEFPLLLVSNDEGRSFRFINDIANLPAMKGASINAINCKNDSCSAIGHYDDIRSGNNHNEATYRPFIVTSKDKGHHWSFATIQDLPEMKFGTLSSLIRANNKSVS